MDFVAIHGNPQNGRISLMLAIFLGSFFAAHTESRIQCADHIFDDCIADFAERELSGAV